jgi:hypothetical protein
MTTIPTIHLNGTSGATLRDEYLAAYDALEHAREMLVKATCNARDFYPQGADAYYKARDERTTALSDIDRALSYVETVLMGISDQMSK